MSVKSDIRVEANRLRTSFEGKGAESFEPAILQPAGTLLNLYGEDIRARAFVTQDPLRGEMMLRPDFTVPLVQTHIATARGETRYTYAGEIFRRQEDDDTRPTEYMQVGFEIIGHPPGIADETNADAEVFATVSDALDDLPVSGTIGNFGVLTAAILGLDTPQRRKDALMRHIWRPVRFEALLDRFSKKAPPVPAPADLTVPHVGLRSPEEIEARLALLAEEAKTPALKLSEVDRLMALMAIRTTAPAAVDNIKRIADGDKDIVNAAKVVEGFLDALSDQNIDPTKLQFEASYGLTSLEYYTGFVFGFSASGVPVVATGGRYDLLTANLSGGRRIPAVGGVIRPDAVLALRQARA
jgi:ATP phosphoribosyltransferase regulatory subunit